MTRKIIADKSARGLVVSCSIPAFFARRTCGSQASSAESFVDRAGRMLRATSSKWGIKWAQPKSWLQAGRCTSSEQTSIPKKDEASASNVVLPESAEVVIIGGGNAGSNALYHLARRGVQAVLLERSKLTSGTTWHTAGLVWSLRPNDTDIELLNATKLTLRDLEGETGDNPGWTNNGGLFIAHNEPRMDEYRRLQAAGKAFGIESHMCSAQEAQKLFPLLDDRSFLGGLYSPQDGTIDATTMVQVLAKAAKARGARIIEDCPVLRVLTNEKAFGSKQVTGVETEAGVIRTNCVLNAAGSWARKVARTVRLDIPLIPMKHAYVVTEPIKEVRGLPNVRDHDFKIYFKLNGESLSIGGYELNPAILRCVPNDFSFSLYELDWSVFNCHVQAMVQLAPVLGKVGIRSTVCGPESFTPDHKAIMGEDPRCSGFFYSCGYNSAGIMFGGGCGEQIAEWIVRGRPSKFMFPFDIRRFTPAQTVDKVWANEKTHESYAKNYSIVFPNDQSLSGRNFKLSPIHKLLIERGAVMEERQGWERPGWFLENGNAPVESYDYYGSYGNKVHDDYKYANVLAQEYTFDFPSHHNIIRKEAKACRNTAALFDMSYFGKFYLCGPEVQEAADYLFTAKTDAEIDQTVYTCSLNRYGGVELDGTITWILPGSSGVVDPIFKGKALYIVVGGLSSYQSWAHIRQIIAEKGFNVSLHDATEQLGILSIQGPNSRKILQQIVDEDLADETLPFSTSKLLRVSGILSRVLRISFVGELGYELHIPVNSCAKVFRHLMEVGEPTGLKLAGFRALYSLSCEKGYHLWGADLRSDDNPVEANLGFTCRKGGKYLGSEAVEKLRKNGVKRKMVNLQLENKIPIWGLETVFKDDKMVGYLRRAEYAYSLDCSIGKTYIKHPDGSNVTLDFLKNGYYELEVLGKRYPVAMHLQSPFDPENKRLHNKYRLA